MFLNRHTVISCISAIAFLLIVNLIFLYYSIGERPWIFYNADSAYLPYLYQHLIWQKEKLSQWIFSATPYFFPDAFLYFISAFILQNLRWAILLYALIQFFLYYWLIVAIGKQVVKDDQQVSLLRISVLISLLLVSAGYLQQETLNMGLVSQVHFGTALMFLLGVLLILRTFSSTSRWNYFFLFVICFLTVFSDVLYLTQFVVTAIITLLIMIKLSHQVEMKQIYVKNLFAIIISATISYILYQNRFFYLHMTTFFGGLNRFFLGQLIDATKKIIQNFEIFYQQNAAIVILLGAYIIITLIFLTKLFLKKTQITEENNKNFIFVILFLFVSIVTGFLSLLFFDNALMDKGYHGFRHYIPFVLFPVFLGIPLYLATYTRLGKIVSTCYIYMIIVLVGCGYLFAPRGSIANIIHFYPPVTACLDFYADKYHLQNGITPYYWEARSNNFLSRKKLKIVTVVINSEMEFAPKLYFTSLSDFQKKDFNFIIIHGDNEALMEKQKKRIGEPLYTFDCPAFDGPKNIIYVYKKGIITLEKVDLLI